MPKKINDITYTINGAVFEVNKVLGAGFLEKVYEKALIIELLVRGLRAESQVPIEVIYKGEVVGEYFADIVVEGQVIIELKTLAGRKRPVGWWLMFIRRFQNAKISVSRIRFAGQRCRFLPIRQRDMKGIARAILFVF